MRRKSLRVLWLIAMLVLTSSAFAQKIAVLNFNAGTGVTQVEVDGLSSIFNTYFSPKGATLVERTRVDKLLQEQRFQKSHFTNTDMVALGEMLNVSMIVVGDVNIVMGEYNVDVRVVNTQTATIIAKDGASWGKDRSYREMMKQIAERLSAQIEAAPKVEEKEVPKNMTTKITEDNSKRERNELVVLHGYLKLYPEELGEFNGKPTTLIKQINDEAKYGHNTWRLPTQEELDLIRSNGYLSGLKYMTKWSPKGNLLLVTTHETKIEKYKFSIYAGYAMNLSSEEKWYSNGMDLGAKFTYNPGTFKNFSFIATVDMFRLGLGEDDYNWLSNEAHDSVVTGNYLSYGISKGASFFFPIMLGGNYNRKVSDNVKIFAEAGAGFSIDREANEKHEFETLYGNVESYNRRGYTDYSPVCKVGAGVEISDKYVLGVDYYVLKWTDANRFLIKFGINL